jgi:hypothetical protein
MLDCGEETTWNLKKKKRPKKGLLVSPTNQTGGFSDKRIFIT